MMTKQRKAPASARAARAAARERAPRGGLLASARGIAAKTAAAAGVALRAVRRGLGRGARCVAPPRAPPAAAEAASTPHEAEQAPLSVLLRFIPPPALAAAARQPFEHGGTRRMSSPELGLFVKANESVPRRRRCCALASFTSWLRCPAPRCDGGLAYGADMAKLLSFKAMDRLRAQRAADQARRLSSVRAGREARALARSIASPLKRCADATWRCATGCGPGGAVAARRRQGVPCLLRAHREERRLHARLVHLVRRVLRLGLRVVVEKPSSQRVVVGGESSARTGR